jgi:hypothetical protein
MDLERVGIAYKNEEGIIADFHAAGRHTHVTELLRNGASVVEAQRLARHASVTTTMKYTHIGIEDQHWAVEKLPAMQMRGAGGQEWQGIAMKGNTETPLTLLLRPR